MPTFGETQKLFQNFLAGQGLSDDIVWVFSEDIILEKDRVLVRTPVQSENEALAEQCFERGIRRDLGICFLAFALLDNRPCCYVLLPRDKIDSEYLLMSHGPKFSVRVNLLRAQPVSSRLIWTIKKLLEQTSQKRTVLDNLPGKKELNRAYEAVAQ